MKAYIVEWCFKCACFSKEQPPEKLDGATNVSAGNIRIPMRMSPSRRYFHLLQISGAPTTQTSEIELHAPSSCLAGIFSSCTLFCTSFFGSLGGGALSNVLVRGQSSAKHRHNICPHVAHQSAAFSLQLRCFGTCFSMSEQNNGPIIYRNSLLTHRPLTHALAGQSEIGAPER